MKAFRLTAAALALTAANVLTAGAQTPATRPAATTPAPAAGAAQGTGAVSEARIAIINTEAFGDEKAGIQRLIAAMGTVDREFQPRRSELQQMKTRYDQIVDDINKTKNLADQATLTQKADQADQIKRDMERKQQDAQIAFEKRMREAMAPVYDDIGKALEAYARTRNITVIFDISKMAGAMFVVGEGAPDITTAFIADYNRRFPATASAATPTR